MLSRLKFSTAGWKYYQRQLLIFFTLLAGIYVPIACQASTESTGNIVFILDASGSMAAQVQGKAKIVAAKDVLSDLVKNLPAGVHIGLVAYGHRDKKDCQDVEELTPLQLPNKEALLDQIKSIQPKGMTPITYSVQKVAEGLKNLETETTIVLVSDGEETCGGEPCALVRELKASGIKFVMHVIGFDVGEKEKSQLSCIAEAGGGQYFSASNAQELNAAAKKVVEKTEQSGGTLKVKALRNGKPFSAYCRVFKPGEGDQEKIEITNDWSNETGVSFKLLPGAYELIVENREDAGSPPITLSAITIEAGKNVEKVADFSGGTLKVKALRNGKPFSAYCRVLKSGEGDQEKIELASDWSNDTGAAFKLLPGVYDLIVENRDDAGSPPVTLSAITIEAGKSVEKVADFSGGTLKVKALRNGKPFSAYCRVLKPGEGDQEKIELANDWSNETGTSFKLLPGVYDLIVENREDAGSAPVTLSAVSIEAGKNVEKVADFSGGTLKVKVLKNGKPFSAYCRIFKAGEGDQEKIELVNDWSNNTELSFKITPGIYDLIVEDRDLNTQKEFKGIAIEAAKVQVIEAQL